MLEEHVINLSVILSVEMANVHHQITVYVTKDGLELIVAYQSVLRKLYKLNLRSYFV